MYLINFLHRNITDQYYPAFESGYFVESVLMLLQFIVSAVVMRAVWRSQLHMNLRLRMNFCMLHANFSALVRLYVIYHQVYGPVQKVITTPLIVCSVVRQAFVAYFSSLMIFVAIDRCFASWKWNWYEKGGRPTMILFAALECIHFSLTYFSALLIVYGYITDISNLTHYGAFLLIGVVSYRLVYRSDVREMELLKKGADIDSYSIARSYQLKEKINLMKMISRITVPCLPAICPEYIFYLTFALVPPGSGYDSARYVRIALYDVWIPIVAILAMVAVPLCQPQIARHMPRGLSYSLFTENVVREQRKTSTETAIYFNQLAASWN